MIPNEDIPLITEGGNKCSEQQKTFSSPRVITKSTGFKEGKEKKKEEKERERRDNQPKITF